MDKAKKIRDNVIRSLSAIGAVKDARFYAELFTRQAPEKFALIVIDPRCLKNPLLESLIGNMRILRDLDLTPIFLIGALDSDPTSIRFQAQRLSKDLDSVGVTNAKLNTASYGLFESIEKVVGAGRVCILEDTGTQKLKGLEILIKKIGPAKVMFLQPSGGITQKGKRIPVINIDDENQMNLTDLSEGQERFLDMAKSLCLLTGKKTVYVIASPLNLLQELFTVKGSGTLIRRGAKVEIHESLKKIDQKKLVTSLESGFDRSLKTSVRDWPLESLIIDSEYRAGALLTRLGGMAYLSKFWVDKEAQGEGLARDIWDALTEKQPKFYWRSRMDNPFNDWYVKSCDGMQRVGPWRVFWRGLSPDEISQAIVKAPEAPIDF